MSREQSRAEVDFSLGDHCGGAYVVFLSGREIRGRHWCYHLHGLPNKARKCAEFWASIGYTTTVQWATPQ